MELSEAMYALSCVFGPASREEWEEASAGSDWKSLLCLVRAFEDGAESGRRGVVGSGRRIANALENPPSFEEKSAFAARHFTGGLPSSAVPVESLYVESPSHDERFYYLQKPADYMAGLMRRMGLDVPEGFSAAPDHLALELEMAAMLLRLDLNDQAKAFLAERSTWLPRYREKLERLLPASAFYVAAVDALLLLVDRALPSESAASSRTAESGGAVSGAAPGLVSRAVSSAAPGVV